ncbi:MAG TPA: glycoside hydrolase family 38 C-terminal domain-containing protein, partial [Gemmatimonadaceae bacterium]|nr:glycoside hydrolase family 38 C-terminal domain-containing protein [Gemmatimonadaceae bacterium]
AAHTPRMTPPLRVLVVAHTHWDREWYHSAGHFRHRLVALVDELLDEPPPHGESFLLDGQAIALDDYLAVRPERRAELSALLRDGRLEAGPWYVLADELLPSGEALVRNLLAGRDAMRALRADSPPVLYCPDAFGHPSALPELAVGFGLTTIIAWRGYGGPRWPPGDTSKWRAPSGAEVVLYHLAPDGYELGSSLPVSPAAAVDRWRRLETALVPRATLGVALLPNGADHHARQRRHREALSALAAAATPSEIVPTSLRGFAAAVTEEAGARTLPVVEGELRDSYGYTWTLQGTLASRAHQKRRNASLERLLVRDAEPWLALAPEGGSAGQRALLRAAWRALLEGQPHDTLCGTSVDGVATALDVRHTDVADRAKLLRDDALTTLLGHDVERARHAQADWKPSVVLRNRAPRARGGVVELELSATLAAVAVGPGSATRQGVPRRAPAWRVGGMPLQLLSRGERIALTESPRDYPSADRVIEARAVGWIDEMPGYTVATRPHGGTGDVGERVAAPPVRVEGTSMENGLLRVDVSEDGDVTVHDLRSGRVIEHAVALEDAADVGDLYTPAIREARLVPAPRKIRVVHRGPLRGELSLEWRLTRGSSRAPGSVCTLGLVLDADAPFVRIRVDGFNASTDHRLSVRVATGLRDARTIADAAFHLAERRPLELAPEEAAMEHYVPTAPLHRYVSRYSAEAGATVYSDGLAEYEALDDGTVAVTLVRAVGALSRHDLPERPGHAGWPAETPLAQSIGPLQAELALAPHGPDTPSQRHEVECIADDVLLPLTGRTLRSNLAAPTTAGGLTLEGEGLAFSAAMPAREQGWIVLRCVNRFDTEVIGRWRAQRSIAEAKLARLDETPLASITVQSDAVEFTAPPRAIVTLLVRWAF